MSKSVDDWKSSLAMKHMFIVWSIVLVGVFIFFYILWIGADFLIPIVLAILFAFFINGGYHFFQERYNVPKFFSALLTIGIFLTIFFGIGYIINSNIQSIVELAPSYQERVNNMINGILLWLGLEDNFSVANMVNKIDIPTLVGTLAGWLRNLVWYASTILLYTVFILGENKYLKNKVDTLAGFTPNPKKIIKILQKIKKDVSSYFLIHTIISLCTGVVTFIVCSLFNVDFAAFWWLLAFMLNYIPTIGSIVGWLVPSAFAIIQFGTVGDWGSAIGVLVCLGMTQMLIGNIIEPKFLWSKLNLSALAILLSLTFWGYLWWIVGMMLSIPIMVVMSITFSYFDSTKWIYVMMSETGKIPDDR